MYLHSTVQLSFYFTYTFMCMCGFDKIYESHVKCMKTLESVLISLRHACTVNLSLCILIFCIYMYSGPLYSDSLHTGTKL